MVLGSGAVLGDLREAGSEPHGLPPRRLSVISTRASGSAARIRASMSVVTGLSIGAALAAASGVRKRLEGIDRLEDPRNALALGGAIFTESIFGLPGLGLMLIEAVTQREYVAVQGVLFVVVAGRIPAGARRRRRSRSRCPSRRSSP